MAVPKFTECMVPLLRYASDGSVKVFREAVEHLADKFELSPKDRRTTLKHGQKLIANRVGWAVHELKRAGLLEAVKRGEFQITPRGIEVLESGVEEIDRSYLMQYEEYREYIERSKSKSEPPEEDAGGPLEGMIGYYGEMREVLIQDVLHNVRKLTPTAFEHLVVKLLMRLGYGIPGEDSGIVTGGPGDHGIDGIIWQDKLGLDKIYIQAKQWSNPVRDPTVTEFEGALRRKRATKGVIITTSRFTSDAKQNADENIVLVGGEMLAELMIDSGLGVTQIEDFVIHEVDESFFDTMNAEY